MRFRRGRLIIPFGLSIGLLILVMGLSRGAVQQIVIGVVLLSGPVTLLLTRPRQRDERYEVGGAPHSPPPAIAIPTSLPTPGPPARARWSLSRAKEQSRRGDPSPFPRHRGPGDHAYRALTALVITAMLSLYVPPPASHPPTASAASGEHYPGAGIEPWYHLVGDVVNGANGNLYFAARDISVSARGFDLELIRAFNTLRCDQDGPFGHGWSFNYGLHLSFQDGDNQVTVHGADGSAHTYTYSATLDAYVPPTGVHQRLTSEGTGGAGTRWALWTQDNTRSTFDANGRLLTVTDTNGNQLTFTYSGDKLTQVRDDSGLALTLEYNGAHVSRVEDPMGRHIDYAYDSAGNLTQVTDAMGYVTLYGYGNAYGDHSMAWYANPLGQTLFFLYDGAARVTDIWYAEGQERSHLSPFRLFNLRYTGQETVVTNARGHATTIAFGPHGEPVRFVNPMGDTSLRAWDADLNRVGVTDFRGNATRYAYDTYGNRVQRTDALSHTTTYVWETIDTSDQYLSLLRGMTDALGETTTYDYDARGNLVTTTNPLGDAAVNVYDGRGYLVEEVDHGGNTTRYAYDSHGNSVRVTDALGGVTEYAYDAVGRVAAMTNTRGFATAYQYDANDRRTRITDALGNETHYVYDAVGSLIEEITPRASSQWGYNPLGQPKVMTDAVSSVSTFRTDRSGNRTQETDPAGNRTRIAYDVLERPIVITDALGNAERFSYDADGNLISHSDRNDHSTGYAYDALGRTVAITDPLGNLERYAYDALGRLVAFTDALGNVERHAYDALGNRTAFTDTRGFATHYDYDALGRMVRQIDALGYTTEWAYDRMGNTLVMTDARGFPTSHAYDPLDREITEIDPLGNTTEWAYDEVGNTIAMTNARGHTSTYAYDALDRLMREVDALGGATEYAYDSLGNRSTVTDTRGFATRYAYDALGRLIQEIDALGNATRYAYDAVGNRTVVTDTRGFATHYDYDALNRLIGETDAGGTTEYAYDAVGNRTAVIDALGNVMRYGYDALGNRTMVTDALGNVTRFTYDEASNRRTWTDRRGYTAEHVYDALGQMILRIDAEGNPTYYAYDGMGNIVTVTDTLGNVTAYQYDSLNRLTAIDNALGVRAFEYAYDEVGNRIAESDALGNRTDLAYDALDRLIAASDPLGNTTSYAYDAAGNLVSVTDGNGHITSYSRDALGRLTSKIDPLGHVTTYQYDAADNLVRSTDALSSSTEFSYDYDGRILTITSEAGRQTIYAYDAMGNLASRTDPKGQVAEFNYDALGRRVEVTYPNGGGAAYTYDPEGQVLTVTNKAATLGGLGDVTSYTYDGLNRVLAHTVDYGDFSKTIDYEYDEVGNLVKVTNPDWGENRYAYDAVGRLTTVIAPLAENNAEEDVVVYGYDAAGRRIRVDYDEGWWSAYDHDEAGQVVLAATTVHPRTQYNPTRTLTSTYTYDAVGNLTVEEQAWVAKDEEGQSSYRRVLDYVYDAADQATFRRCRTVDVTGWQDPVNYTSTLTYDEVGNRQMTLHQENGETITETYAYDADHYRTTTVVDSGVTTHTRFFTRDLNGNLTDIVSGTEHTTFSHDYENRIIAIAHDSSAQGSDKLATGGGPEAPSAAEDVFRTRYSPQGHKLAEWRVRGLSAEYSWWYHVHQLTANAGWFLHSEGTWGQELGWARYLYEAGQNARWGYFTAYRYQQVAVYRGWAYYALGVDFEGPVMTYRFHSGVAPLEGTNEMGDPQNFENPGISGGAVPSGYHPHFDPYVTHDDGRGSTSLLMTKSGNMGGPFLTTQARRGGATIGCWPCPSTLLDTADSIIDPFFTQWSDTTYLFNELLEPFLGLDEGPRMWEDNWGGTVSGDPAEPEQQIIPDPPLEHGEPLGPPEQGPPPQCHRSNLDDIIEGILDGLVDGIVDASIGSFVEEAMNGLTAKVMEKIVGRVAGSGAGKASKDVIRELVDMAMGESGLNDAVSEFVSGNLMTDSMKQSIKDAAAKAVRGALGDHLRDLLDRAIADNPCAPQSALTNLALSSAQDYINGKIGDLAKGVAENLVNNKGVDKALETAVNKTFGEAAQKLAKRIIKKLAGKLGTRFIPVLGQMIAAWDLGQEIGGFLRAIPVGDGRNLGEAIDQWSADTYGEGIYQFMEDAEKNGGGVSGYVKTYASYWWQGLKSWF
jgi:YD repeat-containing protein